MGIKLKKKEEEIKNMVIEEILKQIGSKTINKEIKDVKETNFPIQVRELIKDYKKIGERSEFLWKWLYRGDKVFIDALNFPREFYSQTLDIAFYLNMFITLLDDASEKKDGSLLSELLKIPFYKECIVDRKLNEKE